MTRVQVSRISGLDEVAIAHLLEESLSQGFRFVERLVQDFSTGVNRFERAGEVLFAASLEGRVVGIGGLNQDPYYADPKVGRLRHLYVESVWRRQGIGRLLVCQIVDEASKHYQLLTLRDASDEVRAVYDDIRAIIKANYRVYITSLTAV